MGRFSWFALIVALLAVSHACRRPPVIVDVDDSDLTAIRVYVVESGNQTVEIRKNLQDQRACRAGGLIRVTNRVSRAHYVVTLNRSERIWGVFARDTKIDLFDAAGDMIHAGSTRSVGSSVKDVCNAILNEVGSGSGARHRRRRELTSSLGQLLQRDGSRRTRNA